MTENEKKIIKNLISTIEGAPFPNTINSELYSIWYEHAQMRVTEAMSYLYENDPDIESEINIDFDF